MFPRFVPPAGTVLRAGETLGWLADAARGQDEIERLEAALTTRYGLRHVFLVSSARIGLTLLLQAMREQSEGRSEVVVPGYTCYSVAASAVRAGLRVRPLDVRADTLDFAPEALSDTDLGATLAIVGTNLYGIPSDLAHLESVARAAGAKCIDDAAQCLDGRVSDRWSGARGDAGLFSFDKGKCVTSLQGGVITCADDDLAARLERACSALPTPRRASVAVQAVSLLAYYVLLRPRLYWLPNALLRLGETPFELDSPMTAYPRALAPLVTRQLDRIDEITEQRRERASRLLDAIGGTPGITIPSRVEARSVHPRLAIVFDDPARRDAVRRTLVEGGIGATGSYPLALRDVPELQEHLSPDTADTPQARRIAAGILTLPTHAFVSDRDVEDIATIVRRA